MATEFTQVVAALDRTRETVANRGTPERVTVLGGGPMGRALAAWFFAEGIPRVSLFSVYSDELAVLSTGAITLRGEGPIGTFRVDDRGIHLTSVLDAAVADAEVLVVTGPVFKLRTYAMVLGPHVSQDQVVMCVPAQTFGGMEFDWWLRAGGGTGGTAIVDLVGSPFDIRAEAGTLHLTRRRPASLGVRPAHRTPTVHWLVDLIPELVPAPTSLHAGFADGSGLVEVPALALGGPATAGDDESLPPGAVPVAPPSFFASIGPRVRNMIDTLAEERRTTAAQFGVHDLPSVDDWVESVAGGTSPDTVRPVPDPTDSGFLLRQGVLGSLVPLADAAHLAGVRVPATEALIATTSAMLGSDLAAAGRRLSSIGFDGADPAKVRRAVGVISGGDGGR